MKIKRYQGIYDLFLINTPPEEMLENYFNDPTGNGHEALQDFVNANIRLGLDWSTGYGIMEAADSIFKEAVINGNIYEDGQLKVGY